MERRLEHHFCISVGIETHLLLDRHTLIAGPWSDRRTTAPLVESSERSEHETELWDGIIGVAYRVLSLCSLNMINLGLRESEDVKGEDPISTCFSIERRMSPGGLIRDGRGSAET